MLRHQLLNSNYHIVPSYHSSLVMQLLSDKQAVMPAMPLPLPEPEDDEDENSIIGVIDIEGVLVNGASEEECAYYGLCNYDDIKTQLEVYKDKSLIAIVLNINSPGGWVQGSETTAKLIAEINHRAMPIFAFASSLCASAAYKLASQCKAIYCGEEAEIGCVGTIYTHYDVSKMLDTMGVKPTVFKSGKYKDIYNMERPMTDEEKTMAQADIDECGKAFRDMVLSTRQIDPSYLEGLCYSGTAAVEFGFCDGIVNSKDELVSSLAK